MYANRLRRLLLLCGAAMASTRVTGATGFTRLRHPVSIAVDELGDPWQSRDFDALCCAAGDKPRALLRGTALRLPSGAPGGSPFRAFCRLCPHETCLVDLRRDAARTPADLEPLPPGPLFVCPCHASMFDPLREGARVAGPAARGLYRFELSVRGDDLAVTGIETGALAGIGIP
jgi:Rieske Fe-S protein